MAGIFSKECGKERICSAANSLSIIACARLGELMMSDGETRPCPGPPEVLATIDGGQTGSCALPSEVAEVIHPTVNDAQVPASMVYDVACAVVRGELHSYAIPSAVFPPTEEGRQGAAAAWGAAIREVEYARFDQADASLSPEVTQVIRVPTEKQ